MTELVGQIKVRQDIGVYEPRWQTVVLNLLEDGSVTWTELKEE